MMGQTARIGRAAGMVILILGCSFVFSAGQGVMRSKLAPSNSQGVIAKPSALPLIIVNRPAGNEQWQTGATYPIIWTNKSSNNDFRVEITLIRGDSGNIVKKLAGNVLIRMGSIRWKVPDDVPEGQYRIHIAGCEPNQNIFGTSEAFTINIKPELTVSPMSNKIYYIGGSQNDKIPLSWTYKGKVGELVKILWWPFLEETEGNSPWAGLHKCIACVIVENYPIGSNGKGNYLFDLSNFPSLYKPCLLSTIQNHGAAHAVISVIPRGVNGLSGQSETLEIRLSK